MTLLCILIHEWEDRYEVLIDYLTDLIIKVVHFSSHLKVADVSQNVKKILGIFLFNSCSVLSTLVLLSGLLIGIFLFLSCSEVRSCIISTLGCVKIWIIYFCLSENLWRYEIFCPNL